MKNLAVAILFAIVLALFTGCEMFPVPSDPYGNTTVTTKTPTDPASSEAVASPASPTETAAAPSATGGEEQTTPAATRTPSPSPSEQPTPTPDPTQGMIFPDSDERLLMWDELTELSAEKLDLARNEIFARSGYHFTKVYYSDYYGKLSWYQVDPGFSESKFSDTQRANITLIRVAESAIKGQLVEIKSGTKLDYDQDGDLETLTFSSPDDNHMILKMKDGTATTEWAIDCDTPSKKVYLGDITLIDGVLDLFVDEYGPSSDYLVYVAGIKHKAFQNRATIPGTIKQLKLDKKGAISTSKRMNILMTWFCTVKYKLNSSGKLALIGQSSYSMGNFKCKTKVALPLRKKASATSAVAFTVPAGTEVSLVSTDDKRWIKIKAPAGEGWLEMDDSITLKDPNISGIDAFDGLLMAD